ncbi:hypothetical protein [Lyngbya confervoides]|uniref:High light inducible protein n=1 Tax=Lyngbya confervoides BDU141951 TaxID=1574623 RepID=A0ABD4T6I9_9CYAN|nr:hypothetical protein [Lyngbya confervoides]MCM1984113.1 hypothetical protein [Lyngbya confervoides BDU141951]
MTDPKQQPNLAPPKYGFHDYVERLNGRAAMVGIVATLLIEVVTGKGLLDWLGF